jgi:hypothetical protein
MALRRNSPRVSPGASEASNNSAIDTGTFTPTCTFFSSAGANWPTQAADPFLFPFGAGIFDLLNLSNSTIALISGQIFV